MAPRSVAICAWMPLTASPERVLHASVPPREARRLCALCEDSCGGVSGVRRGDPFDSGEDGA